MFRKLICFAILAATTCFITGCASDRGYRDWSPPPSTGGGGSCPSCR